MPRRFRATLAATRELTHDLREFRFALPEPIDFKPGQYALLYLPGVDGPRAYSMSDIAQGQASWDFLIKRTAGGAATGALFDRLREGDEITIDGPYGLAYLRTDSARDIVCIAGGSGLAPVISIARGVAADPAHGKTSSCTCSTAGAARATSAARTCCAPCPASASASSSIRSFRVPSRTITQAWRGKFGFVHELALETMGMAMPSHEIYFAGPPPMAQAVQRMLIQEKVPGAQVHFDAFY